MDDTVQNHVVSLRQEGLSKLSEKLDEAYENYSKDLALNIDKTIKTIDILGTNVGNRIDSINKSLGNFLNVFSTTLSFEMATGIGSLSANLSDISSNDIQSTEEIEEEKANKLEQYENAKRIAQENLENAQAKREEAIQNIL